MMPSQSTHYHGSVDAPFEGWMESSSSSSVLFLAMTTHLLAMAKSRSIMIMSLYNGQSDADASKASSPVTMCLPSCEEDRIAISAIHWIHWRDMCFLAVATTLGSVLFYSAKGILILRQVFHCNPVLRLHVQGNYDKSSQESCTEALCVTYTDVLVRIGISDLKPSLYRCFHDIKERSSNRRFSSITQAYFSSHKLPYQVWNVAKNMGTSVCIDGIICGSIAPSLFKSHESDQQHYCAITTTQDCVYAVHRLVEDKEFNTISSVILKKIVPMALSTFIMLVKFFWQDSGEEKQPLEVEMQEFGRSSLATVLKDGLRRGERMSVSHWGHLASLTDSFGRVLLIETRTFIVIRLWKGYRDAVCCFLDAPMDNNNYSTPISHVIKRARKQLIALCLVIHAPRRGVVEVWKLHNGPKLCVIKCGWNSHVIQPALPLQDHEFKAQEVYILNGISGDVVAIKPCIG